MALLQTKVILYLEANSKTWEAERGNVDISNPGIDDSGAYIRLWNVSGLDKPSDEQIATYETAGNTREALNLVLKTRKREYLSWNEQLDKLYHDVNDGKFGDTAKTGSWYTHIKAVKDANSKG